MEGLADFFGSNAKFDIGVQDKKASWRSAVSDRKEPKEKTEETSEIPAQLEPSFLDAQQPEDKESVRSSHSVIHFDLERWQQEEELPREPSLEKTQLNIPLSAVRETEEDQPENLEKTQSIPAPGPADHFDFEGLQRTLRDQENDFGEEPFSDEEELGDEEDIEDFRTPADIAPIRHDLQSSLFSLNVRIAVVAVLFARHAVFCAGPDGGTAVACLYGFGNSAAHLYDCKSGAGNPVSAGLQYHRRRRACIPFDDACRWGFSGRAGGDFYNRAGRCDSGIPPKAAGANAGAFLFSGCFWASLQCVGEEDTRFPD